MADNETSYLPIGTCLEQIEKAVYGREVRKAIHDGIAQCYDDTVEGVNAAQQAASDTQDVIDNAVTATNRANTAATEASNVKVEQTVSGDTVTFTTTKRDGTTVSTSFQKPNIVVSKDEGSGEFSVTAKGWNGEEIVAKIPDPSEEVKSRATIAAVSKVKTALGNPLTITDGMDAPAVKTVVTLEPKQDLHGYDHPWVGGAGKNRFNMSQFILNGAWNDDTYSISTVGSRPKVVLSSDPANYKLSYSAFSFSGSNARLETFNGDTLVGSHYFTTSGASGISLSGITAVQLNYGNNGAFSISQPMIYLATETDPTYEPYSNICPIEGYDTVRVTATGKNLVSGRGHYIVNNSGAIEANDQRDSVYAKVSKNESYVISGNTDSSGAVLAFYYDAPVVGDVSYNGNRTLSDKKTFTAPIDGWAVVRCEKTDTTVQIELGTVATSYEPFGSTASLSVAQAAGATVYGGTVTLNEDGSGTLVVDRASKEYDGSSDEQWLLMDNGTAQRSYFRITLGAINTIIDHSGYSNILPATRISSSDTNAGLQVLNSSAFNGAILYVRLRKMSEYTTVDAFRSYLASNPLQIVYKSSTPTTYTLTADQLRTLTGKNHVWTDGTKLELTYRADKYTDVEKFLNAIPTGTKTGDPAVFADGADDLPFEKLTIAVEPHQEGSGDPSPDNIRPITGWDEVKVTRTGKNLLPANITYTSGIIDDNGTPQSSSTSRYTMPIHGLSPKKQYTIHGTLRYLDSGFRLYYLDANDNYLSRTGALGGDTAYTFTTPDNCYAIRVQANIHLNLDDVQIELGSTATAYEAPVSTTIPISLKYATGSTVYGGTVTINRDGTGSVVVDRAVTTLADKTFSDKQSSALAAGGFIVVGGFKDWIDTSTVVKSDMLVGTTFANRGADGVISPLSSAASVNSLAIFTTKTKDEAVVAYKNATVCYKLATPTTYTLTAPQLTSLLGNNTVWCDAGQVTVKYKRDIGKALSAIEASLISAGLWEGSAVVEPGA